jgi:DinB superfamily
METYTLIHDVHVFGLQVKTFPQGIKEVFNALMQKVDNGKNRAYYGLSKMDADGGILYYANTEEKFPGEAEKYGCESYTMKKGDYLAVTIKDWYSKLDTIKEVFHEMMQDKRADNTKPCIEWYKTDEEMICMMQVDPTQTLLASIDVAAAELLGLISPLSEEQLNTIPFKDSWTAAQLATHVTKSNNAMAQAMEMEGKPAERNPVERAKEIRDTFLDFSIKFKSPGFIVPAAGQYKKESVIDSLKKSNDQFNENAIKANTDEMINLPAAFGEITKLELFHFVLYHTQRHVHQLKNILQHI